LNPLLDLVRLDHAGAREARVAPGMGVARASAGEGAEGQAEGAVGRERNGVELPAGAEIDLVAGGRGHEAGQACGLDGFGARGTRNLEQRRLHRIATEQGIRRSQLARALDEASAPLDQVVGGRQPGQSFAPAQGPARAGLGGIAGFLARRLGFGRHPRQGGCELLLFVLGAGKAAALGQQSLRQLARRRQTAAALEEPG
jgi:hypothetical protein